MIILRSVPDTIHVVTLTYFYFIGRRARQNQIRQIVKHFVFDLTCDVIGDPEVNKIRFPLTKFPDLSNAVCILQIGPVVPKF